MSTSPQPSNGKRAVVGVILWRNQFLTIRRSEHVAAPGKICFPGGKIELGESEEDALIREIQEELGILATAGHRLYTNVTGWGTSVAWWLTHIAEDAEVQINEKEVAHWCWMAPATMLRHPDLLSSNRDFLASWRNSVFSIPGIAVPDIWDDIDD
ncbi:NUDIX domain-containing protein [Bremerella cremea]|uniref:8-oxo-dGTP diphosphatase n=1 Tax=Blastopirellula marina TaxID=124 RepID=A0A2S8FBW3_9BACT|nr:MULTISPECIES: NUDIX domain-containing protein [Pirellulaceae]PQO29648.1 NUDIX hydrolase [Blastopirellula marina]RCS42950.1 NUDIX domain-containing protein [Bremerella cremea]